MHIQPTIILPVLSRYIPLIDEEFDRFEVNNEMAASLRESEFGNFYHEARNSTE